MTTGVLPWEDMRFAMLLNTGFFETSLYTLDEQMFITSGNWDGAGMSAGNLQYNWGTADRLTELWNHLLLNHESVVISCFAGDTARYDTFRNVCLNNTRAQKVAWGETITDYGAPAYGHGLIAPWKTILGTLLQTDESQAKYAEIKKNETRYELYNCDAEVDLIMVAYGTTSRICKNVVKMAEKEGIKLGLIRPITLWPFPTEAFEKTINSTKHGYISVEMSCGQMVEDVRLSVEGRKPVHFYGRTGGMVPHPDDILNKVREIVGGDR